MFLFIPRSLCALKRVAAKSEHARFGATQGIRIAVARGLYRAEATDGHRAIVVQGLTPAKEPPWHGFKELRLALAPRDRRRFNSATAVKPWRPGPRPCQGRAVQSASIRPRR